MGTFAGSVLSSRRDAYLRRTYGITEADYEQLLDAQCRRCAVCERPERTMKTSFHVDHDHKTGIVRGLLCFKCNKLTVGKETNPDLLYAAAQYLEDPPAVDVLGVRHVPAKPKRQPRKRKRDGNS